MGWVWALWTAYDLLGNLKNESSSIPTAPNHGIYQSRQYICWSTATKKLVKRKMVFSRTNWELYLPKLEANQWRVFVKTLMKKWKLFYVSLSSARIGFLSTYLYIPIYACMHVYIKDSTHTSPQPSRAALGILFLSLLWSLSSNVPEWKQSPAFTNKYLKKPKWFVL